MPKTDETTALLQADGLTRRFGANAVLQGVSVCARQGAVVAMIGSRGSGQSTFLRHLNLLLQQQLRPRWRSKASCLEVLNLLVMGGLRQGTSPSQHAPYDRQRCLKLPAVLPLAVAPDLASPLSAVARVPIRVCPFAWARSRALWQCRSQPGRSAAGRVGCGALWRS